jgi:hypothetical protein
MWAEGLPLMIRRLGITVSLTAILIAGGFGIYTQALLVLAIALAAFFIVLKIFSREKVSFPPGVGLYLFFLTLFAASYLWSLQKSTFWENFLLFASGGFLWLIAYNFRQKLARLFPLIVIIVAVSFAVLFLIYTKGPRILVNYKSLFVASSVNHNHIGDVWAVAMVVAFPWLFGRRKILGALLYILGLYLLFVSASRSAYLALGMGISWLLFKGHYKKSVKKAVVAIICILAAFFIYVGLFKRTLLSRPYFIQGAWGLIKYPFGVGVGNFEVVSAQFLNKYSSWATFSSLAHNVVIEILAGMGVLGISFILWLFRVIKGIWKEKGAFLVMPQAIFLAILVNFLFDITYLIPTMIWLWFISLGLAQRKNER